MERQEQLSTTVRDDVRSTTHTAASLIGRARLRDRRRRLLDRSQAGTNACNTSGRSGRSPSSTSIGCGNPSSASEKYAMRVKPVSGTGARQVIWNNIISNATHPYTQSGTFTLDATRNLSSAASPACPRLHHR